MDQRRKEDRHSCQTSSSRRGRVQNTKSVQRLAKTPTRKKCSRTSTVHFTNPKGTITPYPTPSELAESISLSTRVVFPTNALMVTVFLWTNVLMLILHVEEAKTDSVVWTWTPSSTPEKRRKDHMRQKTNEHQHHLREEVQSSPYRSRQRINEHQNKRRAHVMMFKIQWKVQFAAFSSSSAGASPDPAGGDETFFMISQISEPAESISLSKCPVFPMNVLFFDFFTCSVSDMNLDTFDARLHGAERVNCLQRDIYTSSGTAYTGLSTQKLCQVVRMAEQYQPIHRLSTSRQHQSSTQANTLATRTADPSGYIRKEVSWNTLALLPMKLCWTNTSALCQRQ